MKQTDFSSEWRLVLLLIFEHIASKFFDRLDFLHNHQSSESTKKEPLGHLLTALFHLSLLQLTCSCIHIMLYWYLV